MNALYMTLAFFIGYFVGRFQKQISQFITGVKKEIDTNATR